MLVPEAEVSTSVTHRRDCLLFSVGEGCYFLKEQDVIPRGLPLGKVNSDILWLMFLINFGCGLSFQHLYGVNSNWHERSLTRLRHELYVHFSSQTKLQQQCLQELDSTFLNQTKRFKQGAESSRIQGGRGGGGFFHPKDMFS